MNTEKSYEYVVSTAWEDEGFPGVYDGFNSDESFVSLAKASRRVIDLAREEDDNPNFTVFGGYQAAIVQPRDKDGQVIGNMLICIEKQDI